MLTPKLKAMLLVGVLVLAIGIPVVIYATTITPVENQSPVAKIEAPSWAYVNTPVSFSASKSSDPDGYISLYVWDFGDGTKSAGKYVNHTYMEVGNFTVVLTVYDNSGKSSTAEVKIEIREHEERVEKVGVDALLGNVSAYIGRHVIVRGVFAYGRNYSFYMVNFSGYRSVRVYVEPGASRPERIDYGDYLEVYGRFTVYNDELEIKVENNSMDYVIILGHGGENSYVDVTPESAFERNNSFVHLTGKVTEVYASYKYAIGDLVVYVSFDANATGSPAIGDVFEVRGFLTYYYSSKYEYGYHEIYVRNNSGDYSRYVSSNYTPASMSDVLNYTERYNNTAVHIDLAYVGNSSVSWLFEALPSPSSSEGITVYVEKGAVVDGMIFNGAEIEIWGPVTNYHGEWEIKIRNATQDKVVVKSRPTYEDVAVEELLRDPERYNSSNVHSWGVVSWLYRNTTSNFTLFGLFHNGSEVKVVGFDGSNISDITSGDYADVWGEFTYYNGEWEIKIRPYSYDRVYARPQTYIDVNITELLNNASRYNNTLVHVPYAVVTSVYNASWLFWVSNTSSNPNDMSVYVEKGAQIDDVYVGAHVEIWAQVTQYNGEWEFKVRNGTNDTVKVLNQMNYVDVNITDILNNASSYNNTNVHIPNATVVGVSSTHLFWVSNSTNNSVDITVYVDYDVDVPSIGNGDIVELYGNVSYYNGSYEIHIRSGTPDRVVVVHSSAVYANFSYIHEVNTDGTLVHDGVQVIVNGTVIAPPNVFSFTTGSGTKILKFYIEGEDGGVLVFGYLDYTQLSLLEGDVVQVRGTITQYNGEAELKVSDLRYIEVVNHTSPVTPQTFSTGFFSNWESVEKIEGTLVRVSGTVTSVNTTYGYFYIDDGNGSVEIYANAAGLDISNISVGDNVTVVGVVAQYDKTSPYTSYYEILPRYQSDIVKESKKVSSGDVKIEFLEEVLVWRRNTVQIAEGTLVR